MFGADSGVFCFRVRCDNPIENAHGEKWATERILKHYDSYMDELATVKEKQPDGSVRTYVDEDLKQEIELKLLEEIPNFPLKEVERGAKEKINGV